MINKLKHYRVGANPEKLIGVLFFLPQINYYLAALLSSYGLPTVSVYMFYLISGLGVYAYMTSLYSNFSRVFIWCLILAFALLYTGIINPNAIQFDSSFSSNPVYALILIYFPVFVILVSGINLERLFHICIRYSSITLFLSIISFINYAVVLHLKIPDYMTFAYMALTPTMCCFIAGVMGRRSLLLLSLASTLIVFVGGSRGATVTLLVFFLLYFTYFFSAKGSVRKSILKIIIIIAMTIMILNIGDIVSWVEYGLGQFGYQSRVLSTLFGRESSYGGGMSFTDVGGRSDIWDLAVSKLNILGYGLFGDRTVLVNELGQNIYAHNLFLELLLTFGVIIGSIVIVAFSIRMVRATLSAIKSKNIVMLFFAFSMLSVMIVKHMVSASFANSLDFWFYLGISSVLVTYRKPQRCKNIGP